MMGKNKEATCSLSDKQVVFLKESNARINIIEGSVRSGKSYIALIRFLNELATGPQGDYVICGKNRDTIVHNIINPLQMLVGGILRYNRSYGEFTLFDKKIYTVGANDERAESKIRGSTFAGALVDEATIIPQTFFKMLLSRLSIPDAKVFATTNPDSPYHWLKTDFIERENDLDLKVFKFTLEDNPSLEKKYVEALKKEYQGLWYKRFIEGSWVLAEGAIFDFFDQSIHCRKEAPTYAKYWLLGIDYGTTNPFAAVLVGFNDDHHPSLWVEKEYYWDSKAMGYQKTDSDYLKDIEREFSGYPIQLIYLDPAAASFEVELKRAGKPVKQAKNEVLDGIRFVSNLLINNDLAIITGQKNEKTPNLIKEIESYVWDIKSAKEGIDKPLKQRDHALDAMRYALFSHYGHKRSLKETTREQQYQKQQERKYAQNPMAYPGFTNSQGWQVAGASAFN